MSSHADILAAIESDYTTVGARRAHAALDALQAENQRLQEELTTSYLRREADGLIAENQRLREALRFYAYNPQYAGDVAREALAGDAE